MSIVDFILFLTAFAVFASVRPREALLLIVAALPSYLLRFTIFGLPLTVLEGMILILFVCWLIKKWKRHELFNLDPQLASIIAVFLGAGLLGVAVSPDTRAALGIFKAYFIEPVMFFFIAKDWFSRRDVPDVITALSFSALVISIYGLAQRFFHVPIAGPWQAELRITSFFPYPNAVGLYLAPLIPFFVWQGWKCWTAPRLYLAKLYWLLVVALSLTAIYFAKTWGAMVALVAVGLVVGLHQKQTRKYTIAFIVGAVIALSLTTTARTVIATKLTFKSWSGMVRIKMYEETWQMLKGSPIFGAGLAGYQTAIRAYHVNKWMEIFLYPHNIVLAVWSELGLLGLVAMTLLMVWFIKMLIHRRDELAYTLGVAMSIMAIHGLVDVPYFKNDLAVMFWLLLALTTIKI